MLQVIVSNQATNDDGVHHEDRSERHPNAGRTNRQSVSAPVSKKEGDDYEQDDNAAVHN
jgi:hypothetical protein